MKTSDEIIAHIERDVLTAKENGFSTERLMDLLSFSSYRVQTLYLGKTYTKERSDEISIPLTREAIIAKIVDYMPFAWEKANDERGLSAIRSIEHMKAWTWLLNDGTFEEVGKNTI